MDPITATVVISPDQDSTLVLASGPTDAPPALMQVQDDWEEPGPGLAMLRVAHLAPFTDLMSAEVDVRTDGGELFDALDDVAFGTFSDYLTLPAAIQNLMYDQTGDMTLFD